MMPGKLTIRKDFFVNGFVSKKILVFLFNNHSNAQMI